VGLTVPQPLQVPNGMNCEVRNTTFQNGEKVTYQIMYAVAGAHIGAGEVVFSSSLETLFNKPVYHLAGEGHTYPFYDNIFKVRDLYESYVDTATLMPVKFIRNVFEGSYTKYENVTFNRKTGTAITNEGVFKTPDCIRDVLSAVYYTRNIDFSNRKVNDKIPFNVFLDNEVFEMYVRYLGKETIKTIYGKFRAIKFRPLLIRGTLFEGGEKMTVWVTDDENHVPVRVESAITVGSIKADMITYRNLRYPLKALINIR
jgi:hypothetical protein